MISKFLFLKKFSTKNIYRSEFPFCFQGILILDRKLSVKHNYFPTTGFS